jgi:hypothetical protein
VNVSADTVCGSTGLILVSNLTMVLKCYLIFWLVGNFQAVMIGTVQSVLQEDFDPFYYYIKI